MTDYTSNTTTAYVTGGDITIADSNTSNVQWDTSDMTMTFNATITSTVPTVWSKGQEIAVRRGGKYSIHEIAIEA